MQTPGEGWGVGEMGEGGQKVQTSSYRINKSWNVMCSVVTVVNNTVLYVWKLLRVDLKCSRHKKKKLTLCGAGC